MGTMTVQRSIIKSLFETRNNYPNAYTTAVGYRTWLMNGVYSQLRVLKPVMRDLLWGMG